jgi:hypothetical protein
VKCVCPRHLCCASVSILPSYWRPRKRMDSDQRGVPIASLGGSRWTRNCASSRLHRQRRIAVDDLTCIARITKPRYCARFNMPNLRIWAARAGWALPGTVPRRPPGSQSAASVEARQTQASSLVVCRCREQDGAMVDFLFHRMLASCVSVAIKSGHDPGGQTKLSSRSNRDPCMSWAANGLRVSYWMAVRICTVHW